MAPEPTEQGESVQHNQLKSKSIEAAIKRAVVYEKVYNAKDGTHVTVRARENIARMKEILNEEGTPLQGDSSGGILWSNDDAFARVMGPERSGRVRGVGFGQTPSNETTQRIMQLETAFASMKEQLAQLDARHEEQLAQLKARHQEQLAQSLAQLEARQQEQLAQSLTQLEARQQEQLAQLNARLQEQLAQLDARLQEQMREVMSQMREMLSQLSPHMRSSHLFQVPKKIFTLMKLKLLQCVGLKLVVLYSFFAISYEHCYVILI
ncbi:uncharacterized protein LOC126697161 isoform X2 [Quercus robur]|uniref:uncharacterized protein LOC126697161 isoform X2 n=1 Tax=Quercus robur TaxID=38942 RepID=UPI0021622263|nr:uncharacterized protein LOC126697161 isoform X2 [Quercus robur]